MSADLYEEKLELRIALLEADAWNGGPFPSLRLSGEEATKIFDSVVLENAYLKASFVPELGGRLVQLLDKRSHSFVLEAPPVLMPLTGGSRGIYLDFGVQVRLNAEDRPNSMGRVQVLAESGDEAAFWMGESSVAQGLGWSARVSMPPDQPLIRYEVAVHNRTMEVQPYQPALTLPTGFSTIGDLALDGERFESPGHLSPRQTDAWTAILVPHGASDAPHAASDAVLIWLGGGEVTIQALQPTGPARVHLATSDGASHEAPVQLYPEQVSRLPLGDLLPVAIAVVDASGSELGQWQAAEPTKKGIKPPTPTPAGEDRPEDMVLDVGRRHIGHTLLGIQSLREKEYSKADQHFERALLYNADDPLLWWIKAVTVRLIGKDIGPELENAHFLAPLEPALRAEAVLAAPEDQDQKALIERMQPEDVVEVACLLLEHGLSTEAHRWISEALSVRDLGMLRYLLAFNLLTSTRMDMEAASQISLARRAEFPPYPWRRIEMEALAQLIERFPDDPGLRRFQAR